jgi:stress response protein SCP2
MKSRICFKIDTKKGVNPGLFSRFLGDRGNVEQHCIDWDISVGLLNDNSQITNDENFVFYGNPIFDNGVVTLKSYIEVDIVEPEFDEEVEIDFDKIPKNISEIVFFLSNHQEFNFYITDVEVNIFNNEFLDNENSDLSFTNSDSCNAIELIKFTRSKVNDRWIVQKLNTSILEANGLIRILKKYMP